MATHVYASLDELDSAVGSHLGHSGWRAVDQSTVDRFAQATGDEQWIHVDTQRAATGPFGGTIAHGFLTLSLIPVLVWEVMRIDGVSMQINYGCNRVRFPAPLPVGSRVRAGVEIVSLEPFAQGRQLTSRVTIEREGADKPVCVAETLTYLVP